MPIGRSLLLPLLQFSAYAVPFPVGDHLAGKIIRKKVDSERVSFRIGTIASLVIYLRVIADFYPREIDKKRRSRGSCSFRSDESTDGFFAKRNANRRRSVQRPPGNFLGSVASPFELCLHPRASKSFAETSLPVIDCKITVILGVAGRVRILRSKFRWILFELDRSAQLPARGSSRETVVYR